MIVTDAGRDAVDAAVLGVRCDAGRIALRERLAACKTTALLGTVKSCGPDASTLASSLAEARSAQPGWTKPSIRKATWQKSPIAGESTK